MSMKMSQDTQWKKKTLVFVMIILLAGLLSAQMRQIPAAQKIQKVHGLYWKATLLKDVKAQGKKIKRGTSVVVIQRNMYSKSVVKYKSVVFKAPNSWLSYKKDLATSQSQGDYNRATKEYFINHKKRASSKTGWLIWVSLDKQRVNIFKGTKKKWSLVKTCRCSTGKASTPTPTGWKAIDFKKMWVDGCKYYTEVCGSGFHRWPGTLNKKILGNHTVSHSCIRLTSGNAQWIYEHVPKKTTVFIY